MPATGTTVPNMRLKSLLCPESDMSWAEASEDVCGAESPDSEAPDSVESVTPVLRWERPLFSVAVPSSEL